MHVSTKGNYRIVFVFSTVVIKITRLRIKKIFRSVNRAIEHTKNNEFESRLKKIDDNIFNAIIHYFLPGIQANRLECQYSEKNRKSTAIVPVKKIFFNFIICQRKGFILSSQDYRWIQLLEIFDNYDIDESDLLKPENFCVIDNKVRLIDYGSVSTQTALDLGVLKLLEKFSLSSLKYDILHPALF